MIRSSIYKRQRQRHYDRLTDLLLQNARRVLYDDRRFALRCYMDTDVDSEEWEAYMEAWDRTYDDMILAHNRTASQ